MAIVRLICIVVVIYIGFRISLSVADFSSLEVMPITPIEHVVLGEPAFSISTTEYVNKHLRDLVDFPFVSDVERITVSTGSLYSKNPVDKERTTVIYKKPLDATLKRRRPLTIFNYGSICISSDGKEISIFEVPSKGLVMQFALILKFHYKQKYNKDIEIKIIPSHPNDTADVAKSNYLRLNKFFLEAERKIHLKNKPITLVFGYKNYIDAVWDEYENRLGEEQEINEEFHHSGWSGKFYKSKGKIIVTLDSDNNHSYHVEVLAENIRELLSSNKFLVEHIVIAGSSGFIGDVEPKQYTFIFPEVKANIENKTSIPNKLGPYLTSYLNNQCEGAYVHTSLPSVLSESKEVLRNLREIGISSVDMEMGYVADVVQSLTCENKPDLSFACLITDFPWSASGKKNLVYKEGKVPEIIKYASILGGALGILMLHKAVDY